MEPIEVEAKTVEKAVDKACEILGLDRNNMEIEVLSQGSSGIFGLVGMRNARIKASPKTPAPSIGDTPPARSEEGARAHTGSMEPEQEALARDASEILEGILSHIDIPTTVTTSMEDGQIVMEVASDGSGILIGRKGATISALQYLVNMMVSKKWGRKCRVMVDVESYHARKRVELRAQAMELAEKARRSGKPASSGVLPAWDRRIIHLRLKEEPGLRTKSKGEGNMRRVVVYPVTPKDD